MVIQKIYQHRFPAEAILAKARIWDVLCKAYFQDLVVGQDVLDVACGYGEFINHIKAENKHAVDTNQDVACHLDAGVNFYLSGANDMKFLKDASIDTAFTSNFLEHLESKSLCTEVLNEIMRVLRPGGRLIAMGPNIRYLAGEYWDFYDHYLPLSERSLSEGLIATGFEIERAIGKFLPFTTKSLLPKHPLLVRLYLKIPFAWHFMGRQFLVIAVKPR